MKRTLCLLALFFTAFYIIHAQSIEISAGGGINVLSTTENHYRVSEFKNGSTYTLGVSLDGLIVDTLPPLKFTLGIENFRGEYYVSNFSPGGGSSMRADFNNFTVGLAGYPLNFTIAKSIDLNLGIQVSYVFHSEVEGYKHSWQYLGPGKNLPIGNDVGNFLLGFSGLVSNNFNISDKFYLFPEYSFYMSFSAIRFTRHQLKVGVGKRISN